MGLCSFCLHGGLFLFITLSAVNSQGEKEYQVPVPYYGENPEGNLSAVWELVVETHYEAEGYDGWYNNRAHPDWGGADMPMLRRLPHAYRDGVYQPSGDDRPNPIAISRALMNGTTGHSSLRNRTAFLVFFGQQVVEEVLDAQRPGCPPEYFNISLPAGHPDLNNDTVDKFIPLLRSRYDFANTGYSPNSPREQLNEITPWIDGGLMYGIGKTWADALRNFTGGRMASTRDNPETYEKYNGKDFPAVNDIRLPMANPPPPRDHYLKNVNRFFRLGNPRGNENPFLLTFGIFWYRYHNHIADRISDLLWKAYQDDTVKQTFNLEAKDGDERNTKDGFLKYYDEIIFNEARKWVIATHQKVIVYDWLPSWLGTYDDGTVFNLPPYDKYDPNVYPQIMHVFQSAAMRFGHTLVPPGVYRRRPKSAGEGECKFPTNTAQSGGTTEVNKQAVRTCNSYWNPQDPIAEYDIDDFILGMSSQVTEREDTIITPDLRGFVFGGLDFNRRDLMAVNIQRGRDHGLPDYNTARKEFGLPEIKAWHEINPSKCGETQLNVSDDCLSIRNLRDLHEGRLDNIDIWPGGLAETTGDGPGDLFRTIIADQFRRIRDGDRFWYENKLNGLFNDAQREALNRTTLRDIILQITSITSDELNGNPFFLLNTQEKCERLRGRAESEGIDVTSVVCTNTTTCEDLRTALSGNNNLTENQLRFYADCNNTNFLSPDPCQQMPTINGSVEAHVAPCTPLKTFDYFTGSEWPYILTFAAVIVFLIGTIVLMKVLAHLRIKGQAQQKTFRRAESRRKSTDLSLHEVSEWQGTAEGERDVKIKMDIGKKAILVFTVDNVRRATRTIDCKRTEKIFIKESVDKARNFLLLKFDNDYDLVLKFDGPREKNAFVDAIKEFCTACGLTQRAVMQSQKELLKEAITKAKRKATTDKFFRIVFRHAFRIDDGDTEALSEEETRQVIQCELTIDEFADRLGLKPDSMFVRNMFDLIDKDKNGNVSFREFLDMMVIFAKGTADDKSKLLFDMYDVRGQGRLSKDEFRTMIRSMMELANTTVDDKEIDAVIDSMFKSAGMADKQTLDIDDFNRLLRDYKDQLDRANLNFAGMDAEHQPAVQGDPSRAKTVINNKRENAPQRARKTILKSYGAGPSAARATKRQTHVEVKIKPRQAASPSKNPVSAKLGEVINYIENNRLNIFWITLYTLLCLAIFAERAYYYSVEREHAALRRIAGYGVTITRGAASGQMFTYSTLLLTMCRNLITFFRETFLNRFIPFDSAITFHKYVALWAAIFTVVHIVGHTVNFYHISTQTPSDLTCLFRNFYRATHELPKFHYWCWGTITGFTGVLLTLIIIVMYVFAQQYARRHLFRWFWISHQMFYVVYILMVLHGIGILVQPPLFWTFFIFPATLFCFDKLISLSRNKTEIAITKAELLPSEVTALVFKRPAGFDYKSGQWVRIACLDLGESEYHPFTLTSAPHEDSLSLHIRALGPWTKNIRAAVDPSAIRDKPYPKLYLDGPFGEGHQDWYKYEVAVLVGGGIGVTPFASILKDIVHKASLGAKFTCKKVYFMWVTRSQKQFEWLVDIIRDVEDKDLNDFVSVHIFITQFYQKFDLRTTMLYICERHFQKVSNKSLFTGLRSITHFGRPDFSTFLNSLKEEHPGVSKIGVFSCGAPAMTHGVDQACTGLNKQREATDAAFVHHFENF